LVAVALSAHLGVACGNPDCRETSTGLSVHLVDDQGQPSCDANTSVHLVDGEYQEQLIGDRSSCTYRKLWEPTGTFEVFVEEEGSGLESTGATVTVKQDRCDRIARTHVSVLRPPSAAIQDAGPE